MGNNQKNGYKIVAGIALYGEPKSMWKSITQALQCCDRVVVVYGRFKGFDLPWVKPPGWLVEASRSKNIPLRLVVSDQDKTQTEQRDLYLDGLHEGDILITWDPDFTLIEKPFEVRARLHRLTKNYVEWDSAQIKLVDPEGNYEQTTILIFRFRKGWRNMSAGMLGDGEVFIASPKYRVIKFTDIVFVHHRDQEMEKYREAQKEYWRRCSESSKSTEGRGEEEQAGHLLPDQVR